MRYPREGVWKGKGRGPRTESQAPNIQKSEERRGDQQRSPEGTASSGGGGPGG